jgi:hypothetical protein
MHQSAASSRVKTRSSRSQSDGSASDSSATDHPRGSAASTSLLPEHRGESYASVSSFPYDHPTTVAMKLNPEFDPGRHAPRSTRPGAPTPLHPAQSGLSGGDAADQSAMHDPLVQSAQFSRQVWTPKPSRQILDAGRRSPQSAVVTDENFVSVPSGPTVSANNPAVQTLIAELRRTQPPEALQSIVAALAMDPQAASTSRALAAASPRGSPNTVVHNVEHTLVLISSSSSGEDSPRSHRPDQEPRDAAPSTARHQAPSGHQHEFQPGGLKRATPGDPSTSSSASGHSAPSRGEILHPASPSRHLNDAPSSDSTTERQSVQHAVEGARPMVSPRRNRVQQIDRCPICLVHRSNWPYDHNPFHCIRNNGPRSIAEEQQALQLAASRRLLESMGLEHDLGVNYAVDTVREPPPVPSDYLPRAVQTADRHHPGFNPTSANYTAAPTAPLGSIVAQRPPPAGGRSLSHERAAEAAAALAEVVEQEQAAYAAGVDIIRSSESRSCDSPPGSGSVTSSYEPSSLGRSSSTGSHAPSWASQLRSDIQRDSASLRTDLAALAAQVASLSQIQLAMQQQHHLPIPSPFFPPPMPMFMLGDPTANPQMAPMSMPPFQPSPVHGPALSSDSAPIQPNQPHWVPSGSLDPRVRFSDMTGVNSPSMLHTSRPRAGMRGAPELAPEDIGNVHKFNQFLKAHASYAASARDQGQTWSSVAGLLARYAEDLAIAFSACALKRGEQRMYDTTAVLALSDDVFEKLYVESCCPSVEYASQVIAALEQTAFQRQQPSEASPLPAVMRAAEAFRVQLRLLPTHAVIQCTQDNVRDAFFTLLFGDDAKRKRMDFSFCGTWEQARTALIQRATVQASWFGESLRDTKAASDSRAAPPAPASSSSSHSDSSTAKPLSYYETRVAQLSKAGALDGLDTNGLTPKQIVKLAAKERFDRKAAAEAQARDKTLQQALVKQQRDFTAALAQQAAQTTDAIRAIQQSILKQSQQQPRDHSREPHRPYERSRSADDRNSSQLRGTSPHESAPRGGNTSTDSRRSNPRTQPSDPANHQESRRQPSPRPADVPPASPSRNSRT